ncbi:MAG: signal peptidase II [bacterium]
MIFFLSFTLVVLLDQSSKALVLSLFAYGSSRPLLGDFLHLTVISNQGAAFGLFPQASLFFLLLNLVVAFLPFFFLPRLRRQPWMMQLACGLVCGGALGNAIDRLLYGGSVVDFLQLPIWPVFNLADSSVVVGGILLALSLLLAERRSNVKTTSS